MVRGALPAVVCTKVVRTAHKSVLAAQCSPASPPEGPPEGQDAEDEDDAGAKQGEPADEDTCRRRGRAQEAGAVSCLRASPVRTEETAYNRL